MLKGDAVTINSEQAYIVQSDYLNHKITTGKGNLSTGDIYYVIEKEGIGYLYYKYSDNNVADREIGQVYADNNKNDDN